MTTKTLVRVLSATSASVAAVLSLGAPSASAHVGVEPVGEPVAGTTTVLAFSWNHGCDGEATTAIRIQIPESVTTVYPTMHPGWTIETVPAAPSGLRTTHDETDAIAEVVYTAVTPVPDGFRDVIELQVALPDTPGETLSFPTIQECGTTETAWIEVPADGQSADDLGAPAPSVDLVAAPTG